MEKNVEEKRQVKTKTLKKFKQELSKYGDGTVGHRALQKIKEYIKTDNLGRRIIHTLAICQQMEIELILEGIELAKKEGFLTDVEK